MKILHCADIHLDSAMTANLDKDKARERRSELLASFKDMVGYAVKECIGVIIIAGSWFGFSLILNQLPFYLLPLISQLSRYICRNIYYMTMQWVIVSDSE